MLLGYLKFKKLLFAVEMRKGWRGKGQPREADFGPRSGSNCPLWLALCSMAASRSKVSSSSVGQEMSRQAGSQLPSSQSIQVVP